MNKRALAALAVLTMTVVAGGTAAHAGVTGTGAKKLKLPFAQSVSSAASGFEIGNTGTGDGITGRGSSGYGLSGFSSSGFAGVYGTSPTNGIYGDVNNASGSGVYGHDQGTGNGVAGISEQGYGTTGFATSGFAGVYGAGAHNGVYGNVNNANDSGIYGHNAGGGNGVAGISDNGAGGFFQGKTTGAYFAATGGGSNPAIKIGSGGLQVFGAGTDTPTPVFRHQVTASNTCDGGQFTILDNPFTNNNPNAFLLLQDIYFGAVHITPVYSPGSGCPSGRWVVEIATSKGALTWSVDADFNVMVVDP
jgi:hypothetical protein